jgi:hypothetical protein
MTAARQLRRTPNPPQPTGRSNLAWKPLIAEAVAATDPDRAGRLAADAWPIARAITDDYLKAITLTHVAEAVAATDLAGH